MMLRNHPWYQDQTKPQIFDGSDYKHPWYQFLDRPEPKLKKPNPPSKEQIKKAKFKDKTYEWKKR